MHLSHIDIIDLQNCIRNIEFHNTTGNATRLYAELAVLKAFTEDYMGQVEDAALDEHVNNLMVDKVCHKDFSKFHDARGS